MKKLISFAIVVSMTMAMATQAFAANPVGMLNSADNVNVNPDGTTSEEVKTPNTKGTIGYEGTNIQADGASYGEATITSPDDGTTWETVNDDDMVNGDADTDGAQINVWATITGAGDEIYKIDIAWGAMKFEFNAGGQDWNTETHEYDGTIGSAEWVIAGYVDGDNNRIDVTNHSNSGMTVKFDYTMDDDGNDSLFNNNWKSNANAVVGGFYADNTHAVAAAGKLTDVNDNGTLKTATVTDYLKNKIWNGGAYDEDVANTIDLPTAHAFNDGGLGSWSESVQATNSGVYVVTNEDKSQASYSSNSTNIEKGGRIKSVYFAFSGTPDAGSSTTLNDFKKVGVITVTVSPNNDETLNHATVV